jgi:ATP-dependent RNA helicase DHX57
MYSADPFAARKEVDERKIRAAEQQNNNRDSGDPQRPTSSEFARCPEVKMALVLREMVEVVVKGVSRPTNSGNDHSSLTLWTEAVSLYPECESIALSILPPEDVPTISQQLERLNFKSTQVQSAINFLSKPSHLTSNLLGSLAPLEASIEYLVLNVPECDLPSRFLPQVNSSNHFVVSTHVGSEDLRRRWIEEKATKAGWPAYVVKDLTKDSRLLENWSLLILALDRKLVGDEVDDVFAYTQSHTTDTYSISTDEVVAFGAYYDDPSTLVMPLFSAPVELRVLVQPDSNSKHPPMYITSSSIPPYVRLHLLSRLLQQIKLGNFFESDEGLLMASMRVLEKEWAVIEDRGPPDVSVVLQHLIPRPASLPHIEALPFTPTTPPDLSKIRRRTDRSHKHGDISNDDIKKRFVAMCENVKYIEFLNTRKMLPVFAAKEVFLSMLEKNRVLIVVGETGKFSAFFPLSSRC